jgi:DNA replication protein DnaC
VERIDGILPGAGKAMSGSSANKSRPDETVRLEDRECPHCGRSLEAEWVEFPPSLQSKYGKPGEWSYPRCTEECEQKNDQIEWADMRREARVGILRDRSGLSKRMRGYDFSNFDPFANPPSTTQAVEKIQKYLENWDKNRDEGRGLYFCGDVGSGKTHLAVAVMNELMSYQRIPSLFVTVPELLDNLRGSYNDPGRNLDEWMNSVKNADLLVLDDLGSERVTEWVRERIFVIVNHRYRETLPTLFTSNIGPKDLSAQLGERTASRVISMCEWIDLEGEDYRVNEARRNA